MTATDQCRRPPRQLVMSLPRVLVICAIVYSPWVSIYNVCSFLLEFIRDFDESIVSV